MKILKKNQIVILVIALMLVTAGYLNYTDNVKKTNDSIETAMQIAELGDATLVSSKALLEENEEKQEIENTNIEQSENENKSENENGNENNNEEVAIEAASKVDDTYFLTSKLERENMYSQMLETYQEIYNNENSTNEQKNNAISEISKINKTKNAIMIAENLIKTKGINDVIIFSNGNSINIVTGEDLKEEQIAQIQNIVSRELEVNANDIHISTKREDSNIK